MTRPRHVAGLKSPRKPASGGARSWWHRLGKGPKWLALTVIPLLAAAVVPGGAPWIIDRTRDLFGEHPLEARGEAAPELLAGQYWATDAVLTDTPTHGILDAVSQGGAQMRMSGHKIALESNRAARIDIEKITAVVEERRKPLAGTAYIGDPQGEARGLRLEFRLDGGTEIPALVTEDDKNVPYGANGTIRYAEQGKPEHLMIRATTTTCHCLWRVRIDYTYRGNRAQLIVPPPGQPPFATTAWVNHKVEYHADVISGVQRHDCVRTPDNCRPTPR